MSADRAIWASKCSVTDCSQERLYGPITVYGQCEKRKEQSHSPAGTYKRDNLQMERHSRAMECPCLANGGRCSTDSFFVSETITTQPGTVDILIRQEQIIDLWQDRFASETE